MVSGTPPNAYVRLPPTLYTTSVALAAVRRGAMSHLITKRCPGPNDSCVPGATGIEYDGSWTAKSRVRSFDFESVKNNVAMTPVTSWSAELVISRVASKACLVTTMSCTVRRPCMWVALGMGNIGKADRAERPQWHPQSVSFGTHVQLLPYSNEWSHAHRPRLPLAQKSLMRLSRLAVHRGFHCSHFVWPPVCRPHSSHKQPGAGSSVRTFCQQDSAGIRIIERGAASHHP